MRDEVLEFLRQNQGGFVSGQDMSEACHVSRTAIWKHIKALRQKGYKIESYTKRGYRLLEEPDLLSPLAMKQILNTDVFGKRYVYMDTTESTNLEARRLAQQGAEEGTVVVTEEQAEDEVVCLVVGILRLEKVSGLVLFYVLTFLLLRLLNVH